MKYLKQYGGRTVIGILLAVFFACAPVYAAEIGTITGMSEKVYEKADIGSSIVANVIMGCNFTILAEETAEDGTVWYLIETDMKIQGYIPAQCVNVSRTETDAQEGEDAPENENENNLSGSVQKQILTMQTVNIRENPSTNEGVIGKIPRGTTLDYIDIHTNPEGETWYEISYEDIHGFIRESTVTELELPLQETEDVQPSTTGMPVGDIDIDQLMEAARQYQETPVGSEPVIASEASEEVQPQEQTMQGSTFQIEERAAGAEKRTAGLWIDMVILLPFLGILLCVVIINWLFRRLMRMYR